MLQYFRARPKDFGCMFIPSTVAITATANTTNTYGVLSISDKDTTAPVVDHTAYIDQITVAQVTVVADADGTTLLNVYKYDASAGSAVTLVTGFDLEGQTAGKADTVAFDSGLTDAQRIIDYGDYVYITVVNNSAALNTAMVGGAVTVFTKLLT